MTDRPTLRPYQVACVDHLTRNPRAGLFLDMGLGKTASVLSAMTPDHFPALVVAPKRVAENVWEEEVEKWRPDIDVGLAVGGPGRRREVLSNGHDLTVISRDNMRDALEHQDKWRTLVIDESSGFKNRGSVRWKTARRLTQGSNMSYVWELTGSPSPQGLMDLWAQIYLLDHGERLGRTLTGFRNRYFSPGKQLPNGVIVEWLLRPGADKRIYKLIEDICISMETEGRIELPEVTYNYVDVALPPKIRKMYEQFKKDLVLDLSLIGGEIHTAGSAAALSNRLSQIAAGFIYKDDADLRDGAYQELHRAKMEAAREIVEGTGSPVLIFYNFRPEKEMLMREFGDMATDASKVSNLQKRWNAGEFPVLIAHPASMGHGLNLQKGGHTIIWATQTWSLENWVQANKRLHRSGQENPVVIHCLMAENTVDHAMRARLEGKKTVQQALLDHLESPL